MVCFAGGQLIVDEPDLNSLTNWIASPIKARYTHPTKNRERLQNITGCQAMQLSQVPLVATQHWTVARHQSSRRTLPIPTIPL